jgi:hypothetical protein
MAECRKFDIYSTFTLSTAFSSRNFTTRFSYPRTTLMPVFPPLMVDGRHAVDGENHAGIETAKATFSEAYQVSDRKRQPRPLGRAGSAGPLRRAVRQQGRSRPLCYLRERTSTAGGDHGSWRPRTRLTSQSANVLAHSASLSPTDTPISQPFTGSFTPLMAPVVGMLVLNLVRMR